MSDPHRCQGCPECAVIFDSEGIHGHVPDRNSRTCHACEYYPERILPTIKERIVTAHDALVDILEAEQGDTVHAITLPEWYKIEKIARFLGEIYERMERRAE